MLCCVVCWISPVCVESELILVFRYLDIACAKPSANVSNFNMYKKTASEYDQTPQNLGKLMYLRLRKQTTVDEYGYKIEESPGVSRTSWLPVSANSVCTQQLHDKTTV